MDPEKIKALFDERSHAAAELRSLYDAAGSDELGAEDTAKEERLHAAIDTADRRIAALLEVASGEKRAAEAYADLGVEARQVETAGESFSDEDVLRSMLRGGSHDFAPTATEFRYEARGTATLVKGTAGVGGNTVPTSFYDQLMESMIENTAILQTNPMVFRTAGGEQIQIPTATAYPTISASTPVAEATQLATQDATFGQKALDAYKYGFVMKASSELLADSAVPLVPFLARRGGEALGNAIGYNAINGTGSSQPQGLIAASGGLSTVASAGGSVAGGFKYADVVDLVHSITQPYRAGAVFFTNDNTVKNLRKLVDNSGGAGVGAPLWQPSIQAGVPDTVLGYPLITDANMPTAQTNGTKGLIFGNFNKALAIRLAGPVRVESSVDFAFDTDLTVWRFIIRMDSEVIDSAAAKVLTYTT